MSPCTLRRGGRAVRHIGQPVRDLFPVPQRLHSAVKASKGRHMPLKLREGDPAPEFRLPRDGGGEISLADFKGRKLVLYFYPKADTPGCTREAQAFSAAKAAFAKAGADVLGVSADSVKKQDGFVKKHALTIPLASDETHGMLEAYGVWGEKSMYGKTFMGITRATFLIGPDGRIARIWPSVKVDGHADEVLAAAKAI
nr:thioredoxin-dependent thiol peroxidase [Rhodoplanes roseus]